MHVSDHSACHYRLQLIDVIIKLIFSGELDSITKHGTTRWRQVSCFYHFSDSIMDETDSFLVVRPGYESLWYHRRALMQLLLSSIEKQVSIIDYSNEKIGSKSFIDSRSSAEVKLVKDALEAFMMVTNEDKIIQENVYIETLRSYSSQSFKNGDKSDIFNNTRYETSSNKNRSIVWLTALFQKEVYLLRYCKFKENFHWNYESQVKHCERYASYFMDKVLRSIVFSNEEHSSKITFDKFRTFFQSKINNS